MAEPTAIDVPTLSAVPASVASADVSAAATPQSLPPMDPDERDKSLHVSLADLTAKANALYAQKKYEEAAEAFSRATEMQAEINGEMAPENADILFLYGRALFKVGQSKSNVLGGAPASEKKANGADKKPKTKKPHAESSSANAAGDEKDKAVDKGAAVVAKNAAESEVKASDKALDTKKPLFQFTGDENFEDSDEEEGEGEGEGAGEGEEEEDDDLAVAFEILDLGRVLFEKTLEQRDRETSEGKDKEAAEGDTPAVKHIRERLADTHDLLAEIYLEDEKYPEAIKDCRASLKYKEGLYPIESEAVAEAHFKLSLALEFASITSSADEANGAGPKIVDEALRQEAAAELQKAIDSTKLKLTNKEIDLAMLHAPEDNELSRKQIAEIKDIIADMEQRLVELSKPPMDVNSVLAAEDAVLGVLGAALGESAAEKEARLEDAKKSAKDLSGLVRKKAKEPESKPEQGLDAQQPKQTNGNGKRKAEEAAPGEDETKKTKLEEEGPNPDSH
ncbi:hypothetical protein GGS23DRAFT_246450 [Durotheca rogersii]|uniref:uncharacterized protein n=1 Tax=Durotheca rogersii TaxID=419775 RepID=UPI00221F85F7|nr:uncharacterized protein GGS23DRAFT_246450 [Durotheca rogersii]KAI5860046.1 hypothetical protein GGS23DRAFT_246450 [Durotheca rogersii]